MDKDNKVKPVPLNKMGKSDRSDSHRMWAAISFAVMLIVIGIPLWWKTTEVHRAPLPYDEIQKLDPSSTSIAINIFVHTEFPTRTNSIMIDLEMALSKMRSFSIRIKPLKIDLENVTYQPSYGDLLLIEVPQLPKSANAFVANNRTIYFRKGTAPDLLSDIVKEILNDDNLQSKILSIVSPETLSNTTKDLNRLRASLSYDVVFTIINSDPERLKMSWDVKSDLKKYVQPLFDQISPFSEHHLKSQWLYLIDVGENPKKEGSTWVLNYSQLPHIITPLEKKLGSGISKNPSVHMILYVASCKMSPLTLQSSTGKHLNAMISPHWGAVQILNPSHSNCENNTRIVPNSKYIMSVFTSQFQMLLRARNEINIPTVKISDIKGPLLRSWELDGLFRMRTIEQITTASITLQSLSKLLGEISNIVINEDVASAINEAVTHVKKAKNSLKEGDLKEALHYSRIAYSASEKAFSDPSLLALLYFPDDQKYAVYIPLFLPIMIPVLMSLKKIQCWLSSRTTSTHDKQD